MPKIIIDCQQLYDGNFPHEQFRDHPILSCFRSIPQHYNSLLPPLRPPTPLPPFISTFEINTVILL